MLGARGPGRAWTHALHDAGGGLIARALESIGDFPSVSGPLAIDREHNASRPIVIQRFEGRAAKYVTTVAP